MDNEKTEGKKSETMPKTVEEAFVAEYYDLKKENDELQYKATLLQMLLNEANEAEEAYLNALDALHITVDEKGTVRVGNSTIRKGKPGYDELSKAKGIFARKEAEHE